MAFTDVEMAILSQCAYLKNFPDDAEKKSLNKYLQENRKKLLSDEMLGDNYTKAFEQLLRKTEGQDYTIVHSVDDADGTGFAAFAIRDPNNEVTVACRGTESFNMDKDSRKDVYADAQLAYTLQTNQQARMEEFVRDLEKADYDGYYFTGHSLGGNLAMYGSIIMNDPLKLKRTVTYNAPGFNSGIWGRYGDRIHAIEGKMTSYQNEMDGVSELFEVPGDIVILECAGKDSDYVGDDAHLMNAFVLSEDGTTLVRNSTGLKYPTVIGVVGNEVTSWTDYLFFPISTLGRIVRKGADALSNLLEKRIRVPVTQLQEYASQMQSFADTNASVFDRLTNSLVCLRESGQWQGESLEAIVEATEKNKKKFQETIDELQSLASFLDRFVTEISGKDTEIKKRIDTVC